MVYPITQLYASFCLVPKESDGIVTRFHWFDPCLGNHQSYHFCLIFTLCCFFCLWKWLGGTPIGVRTTNRSSCQTCDFSSCSRKTAIVYISDWQSRRNTLCLSTWSRYLLYFGFPVFVLFLSLLFDFFVCIWERERERERKRESWPRSQTSFNHLEGGQAVAEIIFGDVNPYRTRYSLFTIHILTKFDLSLSIFCLNDSLFRLKRKKRR
jgi:hypothetical protein